jgi:hypothetical protein
VIRLARSPALTRRPAIEQRLLVGLALTTPVLSFYAVELAAYRRRWSAGELKPLIRPLAIVLTLTLAVAVAGAIQAEMRHVARYRSWTHAAELFFGQLGLLVAAQVLLFMIARVFASRRRAIYLWVTLTAMIFIILFILLAVI